MGPGVHLVREHYGVVRGIIAKRSYSTTITVSYYGFRTVTKANDKLLARLTILLSLANHSSSLG
jgi:hypothetical protein